MISYVGHLWWAKYLRQAEWIKIFISLSHFEPIKNEYKARNMLSVISFWVYFNRCGNVACKTEKRVESNTLFIRKNQFSLADSGFWQKSAFKTAGVLLLPSLQVAVHLYDSGISTHVLRTYLSLLIIIGVDLFLWNIYMLESNPIPT